MHAIETLIQPIILSMVTDNDAQRILDAVRNHASSGLKLRQFAMEQLDTLDDYNWSGIYALDGDLLRLGAYVGAATDHTEIPVGRGVCGTAVAENANQVIEDVRELENYLACSLQTRSEIVVLIRDEQGTILGQIDIDGHRVGAFDGSDEAMLEAMAKELAARW